MIELARKQSKSEVHLPLSFRRIRLELARGRRPLSSLKRTTASLGERVPYAPRFADS